MMSLRQKAGQYMTKNKHSRSRFSACSSSALQNHNVIDNLLSSKVNEKPVPSNVLFSDYIAHDDDDYERRLHEKWRISSSHGLFSGTVATEDDDNDYICNNGVMQHQQKQKQQELRNMYLKTTLRSNHHTTRTAISMPYSFLNGNLQHPSSSSSSSLPTFPLQQQCRLSSTLPAYIPDIFQSFTIWGYSGVLIKTLHHNGTVPYWACMSLTNIFVRTSLIPLVIQGAKTSLNIAKVAPEIQFLASCFANDLKVMKERNAVFAERFYLMRSTMGTMRGIYRYHKINPLAVFKSPLMQIPVFWYFSIDIRKIINGADPELAQQLTQSNFLWITDLTEPDPWYGLPVVSGALLYLSVEMAIGKKSLSGETASKSNIAKYLKDFFQSLAIFMPCFMSQSPAGVQIYLATSFVFTLFQGMALRNDSCRSLVGLPSMKAPPPESVLAKGFIDLKRKEKQAIEERGEDGEIYGKDGVLAPGYVGSSLGTFRESTIDIGDYVRVTGVEESVQETDMIGDDASSSMLGAEQAMPSMTVLGGGQPQMVGPWDPQYLAEMAEEKQDVKKQKPTSPSSLPEEYDNNMVLTADEIMEAANRGEMPKPPVRMAPKEEKREASASDVRKSVARQQQRKKLGSGGKGKKRAPKKSGQKR